MRLVALLVLFPACSRCEHEQPPVRETRRLVVAQEQTGGPGTRVERYRRAMAALAPLQKPLPEPRGGDWLAEHRESGQTFDEWLAYDEFRFEPGRRNIVVQPIGGFTDAQRRIINLTSTFLGLYFDLPVVIEETLPLSTIPRYARRTHPTWGDQQILTGHILHQVLQPRFPEDAAMMIALTATDLWPGRGWNFVFGEALPSKRVAVWSIYRFGDPNASDEAYTKTLLRSLKVATHETGHMLGIDHCTAHDCNMCGSNHLEEADRSPLWLCSECVAKVWWATGSYPAARFDRLAGFCRDNRLEDELSYYERAATSVRALP